MGASLFKPRAATRLREPCLFVPSGFIVVNAQLDRLWSPSFDKHTFTSRILRLSWEVPAHISAAISLSNSYRRFADSRQPCSRLSTCSHQGSGHEADPIVRVKRLGLKHSEVPFSFPDHKRFDIIDMVGASKIHCTGGKIA